MLRRHSTDRHSTWRPVGICGVLLALACVFAMGCSAKAKRDDDATPDAIDAATAYSYPTAQPTTDGWRRAYGSGVSIELPESFDAGDLDNDREVLTDRIRAGGDRFKALADQLEAHPDIVRLLAIDSTDDVAGFPSILDVTVTHVLSTSTLEDYGVAVERAYRAISPAMRIEDQTTTTIGAFEALRMVVALDTTGDNQPISYQTGASIRIVTYVLKLETLVWNIELTTPSREFNQRSAMLDAAITSFRNEFRPDSTDSPSASSGCGDGAIVSLEGGSPVGTKYTAGQTVLLGATIDAPGCATVSGRVEGFHGKETEWFKYWCSGIKPRLPYCGRRLDSGMSLVPVSIFPNTEVIKIRAASGSMPPGSLSSPPPADGFVACQFVVRLKSPSDDDHPAVFRLGEPC